MALVSRYSILACICIALIACVGSATAVIIPQVCAQCSPATYPGSDICPQACRIVFPADTEWTYPEGVATEETEEEAIMNALLTSRFMNADSVAGIPTLREVWDSRFT